MQIKDENPKELKKDVFFMLDEKQCKIYKDGIN